MKRFLKFLVFSTLVVSISFGIYEINNKYTIDIINKNIGWSINNKGIKDAKSFDFDENGNLYIAFSDSLKIIKEDNKEETLIKKKDFNIYDMVIYKNEIILATGRDIVKYNYENDEILELIKDLPNLGENKYTKLLIEDDILYITIGTNTNSGILDKDSTDCDVPSFEWILSGENYGDNNTGAFVEYGIQNKSGEKVKEGIISNGTILSYDFTSGKISTFATGIRNIEGLDFNNEGKIIAIVGGMEDKGSRAVKDDKDYIYEIKENAWYGWPDYSGGDSITSPKFSDGTNKLEPVISNPPTKTPYGPIYQHYNLSSLKGLAVDREGNILGQDVIVFADNKENYLYSLGKNNVANKIVDLGDNSKVEVIRCYKDGIYVLDSKVGVLYKLESTGNKTIFKLPIIIWGFIIVFIIALIIAEVLKYNKKYKKN
ncbi:hypothetical protein H8S10_11750 [Clostridium sp. NSJ-49]|uniref:Glucose / sorbosone dehydrogenase n=1 Tax=Clostridium disporicum TaxID=84024 RepID=A0A174JBN5_9CLOT|nr:MULTISPECIES: hypothetical protein [Clostridium]MBC5626130.1 hypothetical protein [Clostridium sp. NSJ-49]CUO94595.1 glucose / sorbosone dehydrogenase [Clostridium disporicum]